MRPIVKIGLLFILAGLLSSIAVMEVIDEKDYISIEELIKSEKLDSQISGVGGHEGECVQFMLKNLTRDTLYVGIEPGRRLISEDTTMQDILIVKRRNITLPPSNKDLVKGYGFCCQSSNHSPVIGSKFKVGNMAPDEWIKLARIIDANSFPKTAIQSAVWVLSNDHAVSSIHAENLKSIQLLRKTVADIKGVELPWFTLEYEQDTAQLFSNKAKNVFGEINYYLRNTTVITINVRTKGGKIAASIIREKPASRGDHSYQLNLNVKGWPKGDYDLFIYEEHGKLNKKKTFTL